MTRSTVVRVVGVVVLMLSLAACESQDAADQRAVRALCTLPADAAVIDWQGFPARAGFGQREGLTLSGTYAWPASWTVPPDSYRALPWQEARDTAERGFKLGSTISDKGFARCLTAGDDILHASAPKPCTTVALPIDIALCVADPATRTVRVDIRSAY